MKPTPKPLSPADREALAEFGCSSWTEYVRQQADNFGVPFDTAACLFSLLGKSEAFDGFVTMLEDESMKHN